MRECPFFLCAARWLCACMCVRAVLSACDPVVTASNPPTRSGETKPTLAISRKIKIKGKLRATGFIIQQY
uniref:Secreted protein n=1 Tax=Anopheles quadriannulatus TaxID=34691 RepID=A0A182XSJ5_ANOQN